MQSTSELIDQLSPINRHTSLNPVIIFLLTPSLTKHLDDSHSFVPRALDQLLAPATKLGRPTECDTISVIVDKLPSLLREPGSYGPDLGEEGISILIADCSRDLAPGLWDTPASECDAVGQDDEHQALLSIQIPSTEKDGLSIIRTLQIPLATTLFYNGKKSTMLAERWNQQSPSGDWQLARHVYLKSQLLKFPNAIANKPPGKESLEIPLVPLTPPRRVVHNFGNIISQISDGAKDADIRPASVELERSLDEYALAQGLKPQPMKVWALILSPEVFSDDSKVDQSGANVGRSEDGIEGDEQRIKLAWESTTWKPSKTIPRAIFRGARLHQVLGGGGGWGAKRGLLSLDPNVSYAAVGGDDILVKSQSSEHQFDSHDLVQEIVGSNDFVQFFVAPPGLNEEAQRQLLHHRTVEPLGLRSTLQKGQPNAPEISKTLIFGVTTQHVDTDQMSETPSVTPRLDAKFIRIRGHFGALSQVGIGHSCQQKGPWQEDGCVTFCTKLDVPFARLWERL
ncbi:MAG: hypothetical protein M1833_001160 [Piccolia ochrophora]|nr:MAG: hypothetical protein M1833_001160 [Piccolia ochrophora]